MNSLCLKQKIVLKLQLYYVSHYFSNSLIIHQAKTKEITSVKEAWIPDLN